MMMYLETINEIHHACLAFSEIQLNFNVNISIYKGNYAK